MNNKRPYLLAKALMAVSLLLLGLFLSWFLYRTYCEEEEALHRESGYLFVNTIRNIEGGLVNKLVFNRGMEWHPDSLQVPPVPKGFHADSLQVLTIISREDGQVLTEDKQLHIQMQYRDDIPAPASELKGAISMIFAMSGDSLQLDSSCLASDTIRFLPRLQMEYADALKRAGLPVYFAISRQSTANDSAGPVSRMLSGRYTDLASGEQFNAELTGYQGYILKQLWPQILFAFLLFGCVALAFYTVFRMLEAQYRLATLKNEFIQNISHELKTPIATMGVALEAIRDFKVIDDPEKTKEYLDISQLELRRLSLLVEKVLGLSAFEQSKTLIHPSECDLKALTEEVLRACRLQVEKYGASVSFQTEGDDFQITGDRMHLSGVLFNLIDNALKYGGEHVQIRVKLQSGPGMLRLSVSDTGSGIPSEYQTRIFEQFFRVPNKEGHQIKGHGLGLSYAAGVVRQHGGVLHLQNTPGGGATFIVELPARKHV